MHFVELDQKSEAWLDWRKAGITATEAVAISGHSQFRTPWRVWAEKTGRVLPEDLSDNPQVQYGVRMEPYVRQLFMEKHDDVVLPACAEFDGNRIFRASFDGLTAMNEPVEIKCPGNGTIEDVLTRGTNSDAYQMYRWQVQWQMLVSEADRGFLVFYLGEDKLLEFEVARDEGMIAELRSVCETFWERNIQKDTAPEKILERDVYVPSGDDLIKWGRAAAEYRRLKEEIDRLTALLEEPKAQLLALMGDFKNADFYGVSVVQYASKGGVDYKKLLASRGLMTTVTEAEIEACRRKPSVIQKVSLSKSQMPTDFVPERNAEICEAIRTIQEDRNNLCW